MKNTNKLNFENLDNKKITDNRSSLWTVLPLFTQDSSITSLMMVKVSCSRSFGLVGITTTQYLTTKLELILSAGSNPARGASDNCIARISDSGYDWN